ncbi:MAG: DUF2088 domain-containing protein [Candidatus Eisenbacteria bacterium]|uniref:DUF2088 domain-containing protein n=1 Tax=Eiseniibacteriota bacterium TaxID=2212470 RepID=A0A948RT61_UNCEI|nr:DUF2088 domain-containing protein [Candidatus Eisenbacteria bacterium]MBU1951095.1 DUF2088 domain-containing protein [Candidatus Eisenbacteria bacterium]MBU2690545.1 DUF2088 domain-containing protein [Candidatus Eisenbacteria bacterium]
MKIPYGKACLECPSEEILGKPAMRWRGRRSAWQEMEPDQVLEELGETRSCACGPRQPPNWEPLSSFFPRAPRHPVLVVPDATRRGFWQDILPSLVVDLLMRWPATELKILVATGIHAEVSRDDIERHLRFGDHAAPADHDGRQAAASGRIKIVQHHSDEGNLPVGTTPRGTPVSIDRHYLESDARILLGGTSYHYFAGFGGGPKLVFPGLASRPGILMNHLRALGRGMSGWDPACAPAQIAGNPVAEDIAEAATLAPPHAVISTLGFGDQIGVVTMAGREDWVLSINRCRALYHRGHRVVLSAPLQGVIVDAGGYPRDRHLLQVHKSLQHAVRFLRPDGWILLIGECGEGFGSAGLLDMVKSLSLRSLSDVTAQEADAGHLQTAVALMTATGKRRVAFYSEISGKHPEQIRSLGWQPLATGRELEAWLRERSKGSWGWLSEADTVLPQ